MSSAMNPPRDADGRPVDPAGQRRAVAADRDDLVRRQKERFGGMKFGACFFGWLTATGTAVLLTGLLTAIGLGVGSTQGLTASQVNGDVQTVGIVGAIVLLVVILIAYFAGGYVAGRMARFQGFRQGVGVWLWAIIVAVVLAVLALIAGNQFNVLSRVSGLPTPPVAGNATVGAVVGVVAVIVVAFVGAVLGGAAGMRYHRRIDHATFDLDADAG